MKNSFQYELSIEFSTLEQYHQYNLHPSDVSFINEQWIPSVAYFLEIYYEPMAEESILNFLRPMQVQKSINCLCVTTIQKKEKTKNCFWSNNL